MVKLVFFNQKIPTTLSLLIVMLVSAIFVWWFFNFRSHWLVQEEASRFFIFSLKENIAANLANIRQQKIAGWPSQNATSCPMGNDYCTLSDLRATADCSQFAFLIKNQSGTGFSQFLGGKQSNVTYSQFPDLVQEGTSIYLMQNPFLKIAEANNIEALSAYLERRCETKAGNQSVSQDGRRYALALCNYQGGFYLLLDGLLKAVGGPVFETAFSQDGQSFAFVVAEAKEGFYQYYAVNNDQKSSGFDEIKELTFSPDGQQLAYAGKKNGRYYVYQNGKQRFGPYEQVNSLVFSPDSSALGFLANLRGKTMVVVEGNTKQEFKSDQDFLPSDFLVLSLASGAKHFALVKIETAEGEQATESVYLDGRLVSSSTDQIMALDFSPDGQHFSYLAQTEGRYTIFLDGVLSDIETAKPLLLPNLPKCFKFASDSQTLEYYQLRVDGIWRIQLSLSTSE